MNTKFALATTILGVCALPLAQAQVAEFEEYGQVLRVKPLVEQIRAPREECRTEYVQVPIAQQQQRGSGGAILGAIAGGLLGNQVGGGSGRAAATAVGVVAGTMVGDRVQNEGRNAAPPGYQEQAVRQCRMVESFESRTNGYEVTYDYRGRSYTTVLPRDPGNRVRLRVSVEPDTYQ